MRDNENSHLAWLKMGIKTLDSRGWRALKISELCQQLGVTKGSFYHWFSSKRDYNFQVLAYWKLRYTQGFIDQAEKGGDSREKLSLLVEQCIKAAIKGNRLESEINAWSFQDDEVKDYVMTVYKQRHKYLEKLLQDVYPDPVLVKKHGLILYSLVVGVEIFYRKLSKHELELIFSDYL